MNLVVVDIIILTTSHGQISQVERLLSSLSEFAKNAFFLKISCIVVESYLDPYHYSDFKSRFSCLDYFGVLCVDSSNYWTGSVFSGLKFIQSLSLEIEAISSSRIVLVNCDVLPSSWDFLLKPKSLLETLSTVGVDHIVRRSGFRLLSPFLAYHRYPYHNQLLPKFDWFCKAVPTRLVVFPFQAISTILAHSYLTFILPHYSADFVVTSLLSTKFSTLWIVRADYTLTEDESTTGLKNINAHKFVNIQNALLGRISVFNIRDAFSSLFCSQHYLFHFIA